MLFMQLHPGKTLKRALGEGPGFPGHYQVSFSLNYTYIPINIPIITGSVS